MLAGPFLGNTPTIALTRVDLPVHLTIDENLGNDGEFEWSNHRHIDLTGVFIRRVIDWAFDWAYSLLTYRCWSVRQRRSPARRV